MLWRNIGLEVMLNMFLLLTSHVLSVHGHKITFAVSDLKYVLCLLNVYSLGLGDIEEMKS